MGISRVPISFRDEIYAWGASTKRGHLYDVLLEGSDESTVDQHIREVANGTITSEWERQGHPFQHEDVRYDWDEAF